MSAAHEVLAAVGGTLELRVVKGRTKHRHPKDPDGVYVELTIQDAPGVLLDRHDCRKLANRIFELARQLDGPVQIDLEESIARSKR